MFWNKKIKVVTHNGDFHTDDVFAVATLRLALGKPFKIIRTRDPKLIEIGDYVVDVGVVSDPAKNRFDHHQQGGAGKRPNGIPYASFGLVWKKFGAQIAGSQVIADKIDQKLVAPVDANDNGVDTMKPVFENVSPYFLENVISAFRPTWKESRVNVDVTFEKLTFVAQTLLVREIERTKAKDEAEVFVEKAYREASDKRLVVLDRPYPWHEKIEAFGEVLFVVTPRDDDSGWRLYAVRKDKNSFQNRKDLPASWAGKRDEELAKITGVSDAVFCHNARFLAAAKTKEGVLQLAKLALTN